MQIVARALSEQGFAPFGQVLAAGTTGSSANQGSALRFDHAATLDNRRPGARPNLAIFRLAARSFPVPVRVLERHPHSSQAFLPMGGARYLVAVCPDRADGGPDYEKLRAFVGGPGQGINYAAGVWHLPLVALDAGADFAMFCFEDGSPGDCEIVELDGTTVLVGP